MTDARFRVTQRGDVDEAQLAASLDTPTIGIVLPEVEPAREHQLLAVALVDMLARVFPRIDVRCDPAARALDGTPGPGTLVERLEAARRHGDVEPLEAGAEPVVTVAIGTNARADLYADGHGWQSYLGRSPSELPHPEDSAVPIGPLVAAARAAAQVFATVLAPLFGEQKPPDAIYASALTYRGAAAPADEPALQTAGALKAVLVGAGSVGGAAIYALARAPGLEGHLEIVDPQTLEDHNFDRAILATREDIATAKPKAAVAEHTLAHLQPAFTAKGHRMTITQYHAMRSREQRLPLFLSAVDSAKARRSIQDCLPLEVANAGVLPKEVQLSGHVTGDGPCLWCLYMPEAMDAARIRARLIADATGLPFLDVVAQLSADPPALLDAFTVRGIELKTCRPVDSLAGYVGRPLDDLWREELMYGGAEVESEGGTKAVVAAPWVTALGGFLLAGEALKAAGGEAYTRFRLGPHGPAVMIRENPYASPEFTEWLSPPRYGSECLCRSPRRHRILVERYGLSSKET